MNSNSKETSADARDTFDKLTVILKEVAALDGVKNLLFWDQQVMMPKGGASARSEQVAAVARALHARRTTPELGAHLEALTAAGDLTQQGFSQVEAATVREAARDYHLATKMPVELEAEAATLQSKAMGMWQTAVADNSFEAFAPALDEWVVLLRKQAAAVSPEMDPYDFCLDKFERGMTAARLDAVFAEIKGPLLGLVRSIAAKMEATPGAAADRSFLKSRDLFSGQFSLETQRRLAARLAQDIGFDFAAGRLDESAHPFTVTVSAPGDVRLTSRFDERDLASGLCATLHEGGHGLYEQGRSAELARAGSPAGRPPSLGMHESQSLLWERLVGKSLGFWEHYWPVVLRSFSSLPRSAPGDYYRVLNEVRPSLIRVEADEVTYPLHVLLRYELERALLSGQLAVADLPAAWNAKMVEYLGVTPPSDSKGCLQDIHWSAGLFGYFPTYALGALYSCQIFEAAERALPDLRADIAQGRFSALRRWLQSEIHDVGSLYPTAEELVTRVTGSGLDTSCFLKYLSSKYTALYDLEPQEAALSEAVVLK
eukprot:jgi/Mesen1/5617/ME000282S04772